MNSICIITGGIGGMGFATAKIIGRDKTLLLVDLNESDLLVSKKILESQGCTVYTKRCDISDYESIKELFTYAISIGTIESVIHTAGISPSMADANKIIQVNALGTVYITKEYLKYATHDAVLVNIASMAAYQLPSFLLPKKAYKYAMSNVQRLNRSLLRRTYFVPKKYKPGIAYSISKNFVVWYSQALATEYGKKGARILSISPGSFATKMGKLEDKKGAGAMANISALNRYGNVEEIAELIAFCASKKPGYLTGSDILCDGGVIANMKIHKIKPDIKL